MRKLNDLIIAHRGESFDAPENTLASVNLAWERNIKSVEIDIHLTQDNEIVVIHDDNTLRISGIKKIISSSNLKELKQLDAGSFKDKKWKNERIPTLSEVLSTIPSDGKLIIEIKSNDKILSKLGDELKVSGLRSSQIEIIAFDKKVLAKARHYMPELKLLWLLELDYIWPPWLCLINKQRIISTIKKLKLDGINVWAGKILDKEFIDVFKSQNFLVYTWTVDDPIRAQQLIDMGIDGVTTNRASWITQQLT